MAERLRPALTAYLRRQRIPSWDAEDLIQRALAAAVRRGAGIADQESWIHGTVRWMSVVYWRDRRRAPAFVADPDWLEDPKTAGAVIERRDLLLDLDLACRHLPRRQRRVLYLRYRLGMTLIEVARLLGGSAAGVLKLERRAIARLQARAARRWGRPPS